MVARIPEPKTILAVDDDAQSLNGLMARLSGAGYDVLSAMTAPDAVRIARARPVDVIVLRAASAEGLQTAEEMRVHADARRIPIVLLHQNGVADLKEKCAALGWVYPLSEPFENEQLTRTLAAAMARGGFTEIACCTKTRTNK